MLVNGLGDLYFKVGEILRGQFPEDSEVIVQMSRLASLERDERVGII